MHSEGLVIKSTGSWHTVKAGNEIVQCKVAGRIRTHGIKATNPVTVGDYVKFTKVDNSNDGQINEIVPRKNYIIRKATKLSKQYHLIAANVDQVILMVTIKQPEINYEFIDRVLLNTEAFHIETIILVNKVDLIDKEEDKLRLNQFILVYENIGYKVLTASIENNENIDVVKDLLSKKVSIISGNSGVGKSSLINSINPGLKLKTAAISDHHNSGKHTTTFSEMFSLDDDIYIIDTPGIRGFGVIDIDKEETGLYFRDIFSISKGCKFNNCTHIHEPGCAVLSALENGNLAPSRYKSYFNVYNDENEKYR